MKSGEITKVRKELTSQLNTLLKQREVILNKITELDSTTNLKQLSQYIGKAYQEKNNDCNTSYIHCFFIYDISKHGENLISLELGYYKDLGNHFNISYDSYFNPHNKDIISTYKEITKEEFLFHKEEIFKKINKYSNINN